jgi:AraC-like DNA-binding protein
MQWEMTALQRERLPAGHTLNGARPLWALLVAGEATLETADARLPMRSGDAVLVDARTAHRLITDAETDLAHADLRLVVGSPPLPSPLLVRGFRAQHPGVADLVSACPLGGTCRPSLFVVSYAGLVGAAMTSSWLATEECDGEDRPGGDPQVADVLAAIAARPGEPWSLDRMAGLVHLSRSALTERFRRATGRSPMQVLREVRMQRARSLLGEHAVPVTRVAFEVGYGSVAAFSRAFAAHHGGTSPQQWLRSSAAGDAEQCPAEAGGDGGGRADQQRSADAVPVQERPACGGADRDRHLERGHLQRHRGLGPFGLDPRDPQLGGNGDHVQRQAPQHDRDHQRRH